MYTEEYEKKGFPLLGLIIKILIIVFLILFLIWFIPKIISPVVKNNNSNNTKCNNNSSVKCDTKGIDALTSQIFSDNIEKMKDAAISYYTTDRLPKNVGDSDTMTLSDMIGKKLIVALIDKNNKACDVEKSYVKISKLDDEYILKVNIKDSEREDYILVHLGCYSYCKSDICEKKNSDSVDVPTKGSKVNPTVTIKKYTPVTPVYPSDGEDTFKCVYKNGKYYDKHGYKTSEVEYIQSCMTPRCENVYGYYFDSNGRNVTKYAFEKDCKSERPKCQYKNGNYYDRTGNRVSEVDYIISCQSPKCEKVNGYYFGKTGKHVSKPTYEKECKTPTPTPTYKCVYKNGKYYDKNGNNVSEVDYIISCQSPKCEKVNGYYFGKTGKHVSKSTYEKECKTPTPTPTYKCVYKNGKYYDKNGNNVSEVDYIISCQSPKCEKVNGYYFGKTGKHVSKSTYEKECKSVEYLYEYKKTTGASFSAWTSWSDWSKTNCDTSEVNCSDNDTNCLYKLQKLTRKEKIGTYQKTYEKTRNVIRQTGSYTQKSCAKYSYVQINKTIYATTTTSSYTVINNITYSTRSSSGNWSYNGRASYSNPPRDTNTTHYKFAGADYSYCGDTCTTLPNYYYDSYTYTGGLKQVGSTTVPGSTSSSTSVVSSEVSYQSSCGEFVTKTIPIYGTIQVSEKAKRTEPLYGDVCYQSTKTRKLLDKGSTKTKWSSYNDTSLLNNGWTYTGKKKIK